LIAARQKANVSGEGILQYKHNRNSAPTLQFLAWRQSCRLAPDFVRFTGSGSGSSGLSLEVMGMTGLASHHGHCTLALTIKIFGALWRRSLFWHKDSRGDLLVSWPAEKGSGWQLIYKISQLRCCLAFWIEQSLGASTCRIWSRILQEETGLSGLYVHVWKM